VLGWLTRLFRPRVEAEPAPTASQPPSDAPQQATPLPTQSDAAIQAASDDQVAADEVEIADRPVEEPSLLELAPVDTPVEAEKETCPTCGKTGVFAGPPGQRFCTYCALRDELFERAAVTE
jgi:hypothetical protein